jgi:colicin import membrane protein
LFGLGGAEVAIILLFGFLIFGPDRLPQIARVVGRALRQFRSAQDQMNKVIKAEVYDPLKDLEPLANPFSGFSLDEALGKVADTDPSKAGSKSADGKKSSDASAGKATNKTTGKAATRTFGKDITTGDDEKPKQKLSSDAMQAAIAAESAQAKQQAAQKTAAKAAGKTDTAGAKTESFAVRRERLEREHAAKKAASDSATPAVGSATSATTASATTTSATSGSTVSAAHPVASPAKGKEDSE